MNSRFASVALAAILNFAPFVARTFQALPSLANSPAGILFKWFLGAVAVTGAMHTVSAATARLVSASSINGQVGTRLSYQIKINDGQNRLPGAWTIGGKNFTNTGSTTNGLPPGLTLALSTGIISGPPSVAGTYPVSITAYEHSNRSGGKLTFTITFTITGSAAPPAFATTPVGGTATEGGSFTLTVSATGDAPLTYQWFHDGTAVAGATAATLSLANLKLTDAGAYKVTVSNGAGSITSTPVSLVVNAAAIAPAIGSFTGDTSLHPGEALTLSVVATGTGPLAYLWKKNGTAIAPASTANSLTIAHVNPTDAGTYSVTVSGPGGTATSTDTKVSISLMSLRAPVFQDNAARLVLDTLPGHRYVLETTTSLLDPVWNVAQEFVAETAATEILQATGSSLFQFWRYRTVP